MKKCWGYCLTRQGCSNLKKEPSTLKALPFLYPDRPSLPSSDARPRTIVHVIDSVQPATVTKPTSSTTFQMEIRQWAQTKQKKDNELYINVHKLRDYRLSSSGLSSRMHKTTILNHEYIQEQLVEGWSLESKFLKEDNSFFSQLYRSDGSAIKSQFHMPKKKLKFENVNTTLQLDPKCM